MYSNVFGNGYSGAWPFRGEPNSGHAVLTAPMYGVMELRISSYSIKELVKKLTCHCGRHLSGENHLEAGTRPIPLGVPRNSGPETRKIAGVLTCTMQVYVCGEER